ncbi:hypothetical protein GTO91_14870 [Heliobacterium undosum]|uniref:Nucleotidase n=1 Tax=Heliomicrobium undosum TaxID=121734 RepID=A0A845LBE2_9FIRM|nr:hypothetical protein [Heliomicrobium undosum]MZP30998.1 hypothetical protein [Heliomicrobium undosum]
MIKPNQIPLWLSRMLFSAERSLLIGVDICNTIAKINKQLALHFFGTETIPEKYRVMRRWDLPGLGPDFFSSPDGLRIFARAEAYPSAAEVLVDLKNAGHRLFYITARPRESHLVTARWLHTHGFPEAEILFTEEKGTLCAAKGVDLLVEDDPVYVRQAEDRGIPVLVKAHEYNDGVPMLRFCEWENVKRLYRTESQKEAST